MFLFLHPPPPISLSFLSILTHSSSIPPSWIFLSLPLQLCFFSPPTPSHTHAHAPDSSLISSRALTIHFHWRPAAMSPFFPPFYFSFASLLSVMPSCTEKHQRSDASPSIFAAPLKNRGHGLSMHSTACHKPLVLSCQQFFFFFFTSFCSNFFPTMIFLSEELVLCSETFFFKVLYAFESQS